MNIEDLTLGQIREIQGLFGGASAPAAHPLLSEVVLVRDNGAGVHVGTLAEIDTASGRIVLTGARKVWYWEGAASVHGIAARGLCHAESKVAPTVARVESFDAVEVVAMTSEAVESVMSCPEWLA